MGKTNKASDKEAIQSKDPKIFSKTSKKNQQKFKSASNSEAGSREVLIKVGRFEYKTPTKNTRVFLGSLVIGLNLILVLAVVLYFYNSSFQEFIYNVGRR